MFSVKALPATNKVVTVPAPIGGLNARDSLATMPPTDAVIMENLWPQPYGCSVRKGYAEHMTGLPSSVLTLAGWGDVTGAAKLFAWSGTAMYDATISGVVGASILSGLTNATWETTSISNSAGAHLIAVNGADDAILYNSVGVQRLILGNGIVTNTWNGLDPKNAIQVTVHQGRVWAVQEASSKGWYLPVGQIFGIFTSFDFGPIFSRGGYLQYLSTWTIDDGNGAEDHLVAVSSLGELVVYGGTNPNDPNAWALVGVYYAGAPVAGYRAFAKISGDLALITQRGVVSVSALLASTKVNQEQAILKSSKIQFLISDATSAFGALPGWQLTYAAPYNMLIVNVPVVVTGGNFQFVSNEVMPSEPWTQFTGMDATTWISYNNKLYFGDYAGRICEAWVGTQDNVLISTGEGVDITFEVQQAYSYLGALGVQKQVGMYRPSWIATAPIAYSSRVDYDYSSAFLAGPTAAPPDPTRGLWNSSLWNVGLWGGDLTPDSQWNQATGMGVSAALRMVGQTNGEAIWVSTDYSYKLGGLL